MTDVLVVGAGPTGLTLACDLARRGVAVRLIDRLPEYPRGSRGKGLTPRTLEVLDDLGVVGAVLASGTTHLPHRKYRGAEVISEVDPDTGREGTPGVPHPDFLMIPQWRVEQILRDRLASLGVAVELGAELRALAQDATGVMATVGDGAIRAGYVVGCDGGHSTVRRLLGLRLHGHTPEVELMAVGDVLVDGLGRDAWHQWFTADGGIMLCPLPGTDAFQVQASHERGPDGEPLEPTLERFQQTFDRVAGVPGVRLRELTWQSTYRVNVRMVDQLRVGRVFLAGDAAHIHPIAGGLGMNTGIQDAYNLGWKLGLVVAGAAGDSLLDTYEEERLPVASQLLGITTELLDAVLAAIQRPGGGVDAAATTELTQLALAYPGSRLSATVGTVRALVAAGDRAPDGVLPGRAERLFDLFRGPHFTLLGAPVPVPGDIVRSAGRHPYGDGVQVLVRPDGYVGLVADASDTGAVGDYARRLGLRFERSLLGQAA
ncbi:MAG TPA: FAD-dependent monooxygenase, partial [Rugosimonospora sp.]|nr:FAD-dependent monooxygenase [Rugosimonospora sp.]